ncbi:MAG: TolC family protein [Acidobacteriaceae bacterium]|nr:TolC family protein [Acidobacteriaceae bacterium]MBV9500557.1 TolC family protein [Acidobacteriaceae bacterium]
MRRFQAPLALSCSFLLLASTVLAQNPSAAPESQNTSAPIPTQAASDNITARNAVTIEPPKGKLGWLTRPYQKPTISDVNLTNSDRLRALVRGGNLYLSAQDVIALALENNLDIAIQRYGPFLNRQVTKRAEAGGILRNVGVPIIAGPQSVSLSGVTASSATAATASGANVSASGGVISQVGVAIPSFDPQLVLYGDFAHITTPQSNTVFTGTTALIVENRTYEAQYSQYNQLGTYFQLTYLSQWNKYNSAFYNINPFSSAYLDFQVSQNLLQGFGRSVLDRNIWVSKNNEKVSDLQFKQQLITTISAVLNLYWDLVSFYQDLKARKDELATAQALYEDNKKQVQIGTLAPIEVTRAESQVYSSQQDLLVAQTDLSQQEIVLKNALSRNGVADPLLAEVHVIPLDTIEVPPSDNLKPINELVEEALRNRVEIAQDRINIDSNKINLKAIKNELRPTLQVFADLRNNGLSGPPNYLTTVPDYNGPPIESVPFLTGGYGNVLAQIFRRNFPNYSAGISLSIPLRNRSAQADYATNALLLRQSELTLQKALNDVRVDVQNAVIGLRQARARYDSAVKARILQQQTLDADKKKYTLGASTVFQVVTDQQTLAAAESAETQALANYTHARIAFDQSLGTTLDVNHVSFDEALSGQVRRQSVLPANLPKLEQ